MCGSSFPTPHSLLDSLRAMIDWLLLRGKRRESDEKRLETDATRLRANNQGIEGTQWKWAHVREAALDLKTWLWAAMMFTISFITLGFFREFFLNVAIGKQVGGGPLESLYRLVTQMNQVSPLPQGFATQLIQAIDSVLKVGMQSLAYLLPDFRSFSTVSYVAFGYNIPMNQLNQDLLVCFAYLLGMFILGYFFLRTREVAK